MNLELFRRESQSIILQLIHDNLLYLSVALNISYSLLSAAELRDRITKLTSMKSVLDSIELRMLRRVDYQPAHNPPNVSSDGATQLSTCDSPKMLWSLRQSTPLSIHNSMESRTLFIYKYSVVLSFSHSKTQEIRILNRFKKINKIRIYLLSLNL